MRLSLSCLESHDDSRWKEVDLSIDKWMQFSIVFPHLQFVCPFCKDDQERMSFNLISRRHSRSNVQGYPTWKFSLFCKSQCLFFPSFDYKFFRRVIILRHTVCGKLPRRASSFPLEDRSVWLLVKFALDCVFHRRLFRVTGDISDLAILLVVFLPSHKVTSKHVEKKKFDSKAIHIAFRMCP